MTMISSKISTILTLDALIYILQTYLFIVKENKHWIKDFLYLKTIYIFFLKDAKWLTK